MKVFLLKDIQGIGITGEIIKVKEGYGENFLVPQKLALKITAANAAFYEQRAKQVEHRKEVVVSKTSMLAEKIKGLRITLKRKMHDDGKLYASVSAAEIADLLSLQGFAVAKSQVKIDKAIKEKGLFTVTVKLTSKLQPIIELNIVPEHSKAA